MVVAIVIDYLASWSPAQAERFPAGTWPDRIENGRDILAAAFRLNEARTHPADHALFELRLFMTTAAVRVTELAEARAANDEGGLPRSRIATVKGKDARSIDSSGLPSYRRRA